MAYRRQWCAAGIDHPRVKRLIEAVVVVEQRQLVVNRCCRFRAAAVYSGARFIRHNISLISGTKSWAS